MSSRRVKGSRIRPREFPDVASRFNSFKDKTLVLSTSEGSQRIKGRKKGNGLD